MFCFRSGERLFATGQLIAAFSSSSFFREAIKTCAPYCRYDLAMAKPIPLLPPLTRMILFSNREGANIPLQDKKKEDRMLLLN